MSEEKRDIKQGDKSIYAEQGNIVINYGDRKIKKFLGSTPFLSDLFLGRDQDLQNVHRILFEEDNLLLLVNGQGGMGKTTLATHYYFKYHEHYSHLAWVFAEQSLLDALLTLALPLEITFPEQMLNTERLDVLLDAMRELQKPCLLVIDNANHLKDLEQHYLALRSCPNFHLLVTTRVTELEQVERYEIKPLQDDYPKVLFQKYYSKELTTPENEQLAEILDAVGYNTLVIELLAKNLRSFNRLKTQYSLSDLLQDLQSKGLLAVQSKIVSTSYQVKDKLELRKETPEAIIAAMYDLNELSEAERQLMSIFAVLPAENIPFETLETLLPNTEHLDDTLLALAQKGWLDYNEANAAFKCSPVIQEITRHKNREQLLAHCDTLLDSLIDKLESEESIEHFLNATYEEAALYTRYGESIINSVEQINRSLYVLCERIAIYYNTTGNLENALQFFEYSRNYRQILCESNSEDENYKNDLAISYSKLGSTQSALGNLEQALSYFEEFNNIFKELYDDYPTNVGFKNGLQISYEKLGDIYTSLGDLDKALDFYQKGNQLLEELFADFPSNVAFKNGLAISYSTLGSTQSALGNLEQALSYFEEFSNLMEELYEAYPTNVGFKNGLAISYNYLGFTYSSLGNLKDTLKNYESYNQLSKELYETYPENVKFKNDYAISYSRLGETYSALGNLEQALRFFEDFSNLFKELYDDFPTNVGFKNGLANSYEKLGQTQNTLGNLEQALHFFEQDAQLTKELYEAFPSNVAFKNGLAISYAKLGAFYGDHGKDKDKARAYFLEAEAHWAALVAAFPAYVEFGRFLEAVRAVLAEL